MKMTFRWYGRESDPIPLKYVKQIPGMSGLMGLLDKPAGVDWPEEEVKALVEEVHAAGLELEVVESVNVHEDIKMGLPTRDEYIANYISTIRTLAKYGVKVIIYNFMPVFDWLRTDLARVIPEDGSNSLYFDEKDLGEMGPMEIVRRTAADSQGFTLPGWEPERLALLETTLRQYEKLTPDDLRANYKYFLDAVIPVCEEVGIRMACHPDDPAWPIFGLPRIAHSQEDFDKIIKLHDSPREHRLPLHRISGLLAGQRHSVHHPPLRRDEPHRRDARSQHQVLGLPSLPRSRAPVRKRVT